MELGKLTLLTGANSTGKSSLINGILGVLQSKAFPLEFMDKLTREGRLVNVSNEEIKKFKNKYFTKAVEKKLRSNNEDRNHIPVVLLSERKYALTKDKNFTYDLENFPGFKVLVSSHPENIPYDKYNKT